MLKREYDNVTKSIEGARLEVLRKLSFDNAFGNDDPYAPKRPSRIPVLLS